MKKKKKILIFLLASIATFGINKSVYAENGYIDIETTIRRWTPTNDLIFQNDKCSSAYLTDGNITVNLSCDGSEQRLGYVFDGESDSWNNYQYKFTTGKDVRLVERYHYSDGCGEPLCSKAEIGTISTGNSLRLSFNVSDDPDETRENTSSLEEEIQNSTFDEYKNESYTVYVDKVYEDEPGGDTTSYYYTENDGSKTDVLSSGEVLLPIYFIKYNFSATGNMMPSGSWSVSYNTTDKPYTLDSVHFNMGNLSVEYGTSTDGILLDRGSYDGNYYSKLRFKDFYNIGHSESESSNGFFDVSYSGALSYKEGTEYKSSSYNHIGYSTGSASYEKLSATNRNVQASKRTYNPNQVVRVQRTENSDNNTYYYTLNREISSNISVPNGVFYNVLPFVIIMATAGIGIIVIKKKSVQI